MQYIYNITMDHRVSLDKYHPGNEVCTNITWGAKIGFSVQGLDMLGYKNHNNRLSFLFLKKHTYAKVYCSDSTVTAVT